MERRELERWLKRNGFAELPRRSSGHSYWRGPGGLTLSITAHDKEIRRGILQQYLRRLESVGFDRRRLVREWGLATQTASVPKESP